MSSLKFHAGKRRGEEGNASETRRCFRGAAELDEEAESDTGGNGAVKENVDVEGSLLLSSAGFSMVV